MILKRKMHIWLYLMAAVTAILLGMEIQLTLSSVVRARETRLAEQAIRQLSARPIEAARVRSEQETEEKRLLSESGLHNIENRLESAKEDVLILVNAWNPIPDGYDVKLQEVGEGHMMDERCADALLQMLDDCTQAGNDPVIASAYRTTEKQQELFDNKVRRVIMSGVSETWAPEVAAQTVAVPGTSEHQLGLAVDLMDKYYPYLNAAQENMPTQRWLIENCWEYGFILRYPNGTTEITGIIYEPWHYRYVGLNAAKEIHELGITLEEYLQLKEDNILVTNS